jgi:hypothetical protein
MASPRTFFRSIDTSSGNTMIAAASTSTAMRCQWYRPDSLIANRLTM